MAGGWSRDGAIQDQIDASIEDAVKQARSQLPKGAGLSHCEKCGIEISKARREAVSGVRHCVECQEQLDNTQTPSSGINRRGSKNSQLR